MREIADEQYEDSEGEEYYDEDHDDETPIPLDNRSGDPEGMHALGLENRSDGPEGTNTEEMVSTEESLIPFMKTL